MDLHGYCELECNLHVFCLLFTAIQFRLLFLLVLFCILFHHVSLVLILYVTLFTLSQWVCVMFVVCTFWSVLQCHLQCLQCFCLTDPRGILCFYGHCLYVFTTLGDQPACLCDVYHVWSVVVVMIYSPYHSAMVHGPPSSCWVAIVNCYRKKHNFWNYHGSYHTVWLLTNAL